MKIIILLSISLLGLNDNSPLHQSTAGQEARRTCKSVSSCEEAVILWCNGYGRADGDSDGIPCETVCHSLEQVDAIRSAIGC